MVKWRKRGMKERLGQGIEERKKWNEYFIATTERP